jgi:hypothetical protein
VPCQAIITGARKIAATVPILDICSARGGVGRPGRTGSGGISGGRLWVAEGVFCFDLLVAENGAKGFIPFCSRFRRSSRIRH